MIDFNDEMKLLSILKSLQYDALKDNAAVCSALNDMTGDNFCYVEGGREGAARRIKRLRLALWVLGQGVKGKWIKWRKNGPRPPAGKDVLVKEPASGLLGVGRMYNRLNLEEWRLATPDNGIEIRHRVRCYMELP